jgi:RNA polymerase sigma-70 factor (ECF subfamily)
LTDAIEQADLEALVGLLVADARLSMPPAMLEYRGVDVARRLFTAATFRPGRSYRVVPTRANGQPALGMYTADPHTGVYRGYSLLVVTIAGDRITVVAGFDASVMPRFGLPRTLPDTDWTTDSSAT